MAWNKKRNKSKREFCWQVKRIATTHNNNTFCCDLILIVLDFMYTAFVLRVYYIVPQTTPHVVRSQLKTMKTIISYYFYCPWSRSLFSAFIRWSVFCYCNKHTVPASKRFWIMLIRRFSWYQNTKLRVERVSERVSSKPKLDLHTNSWDSAELWAKRAKFHSVSVIPQFWLQSLQLNKLWTNLHAHILIWQKLTFLNFI